MALWNIYRDFYNYKLEMLKKWCEHEDIPYTEWNGHKHQEVLEDKKQCYLVQYAAGQEAWNCITINYIDFFSQNYSCKSMEHAAGSIDSMNIGYSDLHYFIFLSNSSINKQIWDAFGMKKKFQELKFVLK